MSSTAKQRSAWRDVPSQQWNDLRWQLSNLVRTTDELGALLGLPERELSAIRAQSQRFRWAISPYYFSLIDPSDPSDPIRRMVVPSADEDTSEGEDDPLGEKRDQVAPGLTHRYPDRVLFVVTSFCSSYCRFCIRKRNWRHSDAARSRAEIDEAIEILEAAQAVQWGPIRHRNELHDRASYRFFWQVLERAHATGRAMPTEAQPFFKP